MRQSKINELIGHVKRIDKQVASCFGVGFEKLDRKAFDPNGKYEKLGAIGVKWVRIQSGWERTETVKGIYDFSWLEEVVDNLLDNGMTPWICLCYGNPLYTDSAKNVFGSVGCPPIFSDMEKQAWLNYVTALAKKFAGKVIHYEIWNEPDGIQCWKHGTDAKEYAAFANETAKRLKEINKNIYIIGGALGITERWACYLKKALDNGLADNIDAISFHHYSTKIENNISFYKQIKDLIYEYKPLDIIRGENGCPSSIMGNGALHSCAWNEERQAKFLLCSLAVDLKCGVKFTSWFSAIDMMEGLFGVRGDVESYKDFAYYGLLGAQFNDKGESIGEFKPKISYYALQNLCAIFCGEFKTFEFPHSTPYPVNWSYDIDDFDESGDDFIKVGFKRDNGSQAFLYYKPISFLTTEFESTVSFVVQNVSDDVKLIDTLNGEVYQVAKENIIKRERYGDYCMEIKNITVKNYPLIITFGNFCNKNIEIIKKLV